MFLHVEGDVESTVENDDLDAAAAANISDVGNICRLIVEVSAVVEEDEGRWPAAMAAAAARADGGDGDGPKEGGRGRS